MSDYSDTTIEACDNYTWTLHGNTNTYTASGTYINDYSAYGCTGADTLHLTIRHSSITADTFDVCDSLVWTSGNGNTYTASTTDTLRYTNAAGCDSMLTLNLNIRHSNSSNDTHDVCDNFVWTSGNGNIYTTSNNTDTVHRTNAAGCDSLVTLRLTIHTNTHTSQTLTACDTLRWHDTLRTATGIYIFRDAVPATGCEGTDTLHLTINHSSNSVEIDTVCDSLVWHGRNFNASTDTATFTITNAAGCDSTVTLHLTVNYNSTSIEVDTACGSYTWHGRNFNASTDTATYTLANAAGCDSTVTLHLTVNHCSTIDTTACDSLAWNGTIYTNDGTYINGRDTLILTIGHSSNGSHTDTACGSYTWLGRTFNTSTDTATYTLTNAVGCDSIITLRLTLYVDSSASYTVSDTDSYTWPHIGPQHTHGNDSTYTAGGTYTNSYTTADGCASVDTLHLTIITIDTSSVCTVIATTSNTLMGYVTVDGYNRVRRGNRCTIRASANTGYHFVRWSNGATANPYTFTVTQDTFLVAIFEGQRYTVTVVNGKPGRGTVTGSGSAQYGSRRNISASPVTGYLFSRWNDGDTNASRTITVTRDTTFTAYFDIRRYSIEVLAADSSQGTVSGGGSYDYLDYATLNATPANGYTFGHWSDGDSTNPRRLQVRGDSTLTAYFVPSIHRYTLTVTSGNSAAGSVSGSGTYDEGTAVVISARAVTGYEFVQWNDSVTSNPRTVTINSDTLFTAAFREIDVPDTFTVTATSNDGGMGRVSGGGRYEEGSRVQLNAYPSARCHFMRWSDGNSDNPRNITVDRDISLTALFAHDSVTITLRANDDRMGTVTGGGIYPVDATATITATPNSGYRFVCWSTGEAANPHSFTVRYAATYTAIFESTATEGIDGADGTAVRVWGSDRTIHIMGLNGGPLRVYDITGRTVAERNAATGSIAITVAYPGLYMVHAGTATHKVLIR